MTAAQHHEPASGAAHDSAAKGAFRPRAQQHAHLSAEELLTIMTAVRQLQYEGHASQAASGPGSSGFPWATVGAVLAAVVAALFTGMTFLNALAQDKVERGTMPLNAQITEMDKRLTGRLDVIDKTLERVNTKLDSIDSRMSNVELRLERVDSKVTK
ncbi:hypothetical protein [Paracidovorax citrulli]